MDVRRDTVQARIVWVVVAVLALICVAMGFWGAAVR